MEEKKKRNPPAGRALEAAAEVFPAIDRIEREMVTMKPRTRAAFECLLAGDDELIVAIKSGNKQWFTGITKLLTNNDGSRIMSHRLTLENVDDLCASDYARLRKICAYKVRELTGSAEYGKILLPMREYLRRFQPLALAKMANLMHSAEKEDIQFRATKDLLDRAEALDKEQNSPSTVVPVQVNIMLTDKDGNTRPLGG